MAFSDDIPSLIMENSNKIILISYVFPKQIIYSTEIFVHKTWTVDVIMNLIGLTMKFSMRDLYIMLCLLEILSSDLRVYPPVFFL
jgi:hypothetical protein